MYKMKSNRDIFKPGYLTSLTDDVLSGKPASDIKRLTTAEMARIPEIYANVDYSPEHFNLLDDYKGTYPSILEAIEDKKVYKTGNNKDILGMDIKSITLLMYLKPRTAYWKPEKPQIYDTSVCGAVPLPLLGFKRFKRIPYSAWNSAYDDPERAGWNCFRVDYGYNYIDLKETDCALDIATQCTFNMDLLLGKTLASTTYNEATNEVELLPSYGLAILSHFHEDMWRPTVGDVRNYRAYNMGNHSGSYASVYNTAKIPTDWEEDEELTEREYRILLHNKCSTPMRLLMSQRWAWYGNHRNTDMICDFQNWDNMPKSVDLESTQMEGLEPQKPVTRIKERFGIGVNNG